MTAERVLFAEDFCALWRCRPGQLEICLWGTAELATEPAAAMAMNEARAVAEMERVREVRLDLRGLEFMASPCMKYFINWFVGMHEAGAAPYTVCVVWDPVNRWQTRVKDVLCSLAPSVLTAVEGQGPKEPRPTSR
jgi:hypothetical protein